MLNIEDIKYYIKKNNLSLNIKSEFKSICDYKCRIKENNDVIVILYLKQNQYGGEVNWYKTLTIKSSDIILYLRKEKLKKLNYDKF